MEINNIKSNDFQREVELRESEYKEAIERVLKSGWFILGKEVDTFENRFASFLGVKHCIGVANGLEALQISLIALGIGQGDEVITTPLSAMATTLSIMAVGAKPIFVDIDNRGQMDIQQIERQITKKTKAILPVHLYGLSCYPQELKELCKKNDIKYIEDACQAHGSKFNDQMLGTFGDISCFSFYPTKNLGAFGDGGAVCTNDDALAAKCRTIRDYGQTQKYTHQCYGLNSRLDEIQAALLSVKLEHLDDDNSRRNKIANIYQEIIGESSKISILSKLKNERPNYHQFPILVDDRDTIQSYLKKHGISSLIHYPIAIPDQPLFNNKNINMPIHATRKFVKKILSLPIHPFLSDNEATYIGKTLVNFFN